ncbi:hypothetical protein [Bosea sp. 2RAB26]|uniref:hypothetical protein n=1 Tax=Bosea sp. 2RAB26 TaxID=3237476 RepID=UPI003F935F3E
MTAPYFQDGFNFAKHRAQPVLAALPGLERKGGSWSWELKLPPGYRLCKFLSRRVHAIPGAVVILSRSFDGIKVFAWLPSDISFYEQRSEIIDLSIDGVREDLFAAAEAKRKCGGPRTTTLLTPDYGQGASNYLALRTDTRWNALFRPVVDVEQLRLPKMKATDMNWPHAPPYANGEVVRGNTD